MMGFHLSQNLPQLVAWIHMKNYLSNQSLPPLVNDCVESAESFSYSVW